MEAIHFYQVITISLVTIIPFTILLLLMKLKFMSPSLGIAAGALVIFVKDYLKRILTIKYGFTETARVQGTFITVIVIGIYIYFTYKEIKKREQENQDKASKTD